MTKPLRVDGADISHHQSGKLDLGAFKKAGGRFLYHKATEGISFVDSRYAARRNETRRAGIPFGAYHFARPTLNDARKEAAHFLATAAPKPGDLCPALDLETNDAHLSQRELTAWAGAFAVEIRKALNVLPVIYTPFNLDDNFGCILWQPRYNDDNRPPVTAEPWSAVDIWQFSNGVLGVPDQIKGLGHVDLNHMRAGLKVGDFTIPTPPVQSGVIRFITQNVRAVPKMPQPDVVEDVELTASQAGVVAWQEIGPDRYKKAVDDLSPEFTAHLPVGAGNSNPISWRSRYWTEQDTGEILLNAKDPTSTVRGSDRYLVWVLLKHNGTGALVLVNNVHYVARAWGRRTGQEAKEQPVRQEMWLAGNKIHRAAIRNWVKLGYPIVSLGDYNSQNRRALPLGKTIGGKTVRYVVGEKSIDQVVFINGTDWVWVIDDTDGELLPGRNSDHQGRRGQARLSERT